MADAPVRGNVRSVTVTQCGRTRRPAPSSPGGWARRRLDRRSSTSAASTSPASNARAVWSLPICRRLRPARSRSSCCGNGRRRHEGTTRHHIAMVPSRTPSIPVSVKENSLYGRWHKGTHVMADYKIISSDSHLNESLELFKRLPPAYRGRAPAWRRSMDGTTSSSRASHPVRWRRPTRSTRTTCCATGAVRGARTSVACSTAPAEPTWRSA